MQRFDSQTSGHCIACLMTRPPWRYAYAVKCCLPYTDAETRVQHDKRALRTVLFRAVFYFL